jgi:methylated-DNA-[protein]-cysteine S-methyltransferase
MKSIGTRHAVVGTAIGEITLVAAGHTLAGVYFPGHWYKPDSRTFGVKAVAGADPVLSVAERQIREYLDGARRAFAVPTATHGDAFQERVWTLLKTIPYGQTTTYGELAKRLGQSELARDVGQAVGRNPLAMIIPCHRVVGKDGKLTGYAGGLSRKKALLELEGQRAHSGSNRSEPRYRALELNLASAVSER